MSGLNTLRGASLAVLLVLLAACDEQPQGQATQQPQGQPPVEVGVVTVEARRLPVTAELPGRISAYRVAEIRPQVDGIIRERLFHEGSVVEAGEPLYRIDDKRYRAALASAEAELRRAEADVALTASKARRAGELLETSAVSRQNYDEAIAAQKQAEADAAAAEAAVEAAQIDLDYTTVTSPIAGRIGKSSVSEGALVTANQETALAVVQQIDPIYVDLSQSLAQLAQLRQELAVGEVEQSAGSAGRAPVTVVMDSTGTIYPRKGELLFSDVTVEPDTSTVQLRAVVPNPDAVLLPGMFVRARVEQGVRENAILVPQQAVVRTPDGRPQVWLLDGQDQVKPQAVVTERAVGNAWLIEQGLQPGDRVVAEGIQKLRPGAKVSAVPATVKVALDKASEG